jgi:hypothetical protein
MHMRACPSAVRTSVGMAISHRLAGRLPTGEIVGWPVAHLFPPNATCTVEVTFTATGNVSNRTATLAAGGTSKALTGSASGLAPALSLTLLNSGLNTNTYDAPESRNLSGRQWHPRSRCHLQHRLHDQRDTVIRDLRRHNHHPERHGFRLRDFPCDRLQHHQPYRLWRLRRRKRRRRSQSLTAEMRRLDVLVAQVCAVAPDYPASLRSSMERIASRWLGAMRWPQSAQTAICAGSSTRARPAAA